MAESAEVVRKADGLVGFTGGLRLAESGFWSVSLPDSPSDIRSALSKVRAFAEALLDRCSTGLRGGNGGLLSTASESCFIGTVRGFGLETPL